MDKQPPSRPVEVFPVMQFLALIGAITLVLVVVFAITPGPPPRPTPTPSPVVVAAPPTQTPSPVPASPTPQMVTAGLDPAQVAAGERIYQTTCTACHGFNARGISGLGLSLVGTDFIESHTDEELHDFLVVGRMVTDPENSTGVAMPARGGNPSLTDNDLYAVIAYIRSLNVPADRVVQAATASPTPSGPRPTPTEFTPPALAIASAAQPDTQAEAAPDLFFSSGEIAYNRACAGCHGLDGGGVPFTGSSLFDSDVLSQAEGIALFEYLTRSQPPEDPREAYPHPYRGGYPLLTDEQILNVIAYLYELVRQAD